jgi:hypothetical protein
MYARRRRTLLIVGGSVVAALCLVAPFLVRRTVRFYSDGSGLRREVASAKPWLREVLWQMRPLWRI